MLDFLEERVTCALPNPPLQAEGRVGRCAPSCARR